MKVLKLTLAHQTILTTMFASIFLATFTIYNPTFCCQQVYIKLYYLYSYYYIVIF